MATESDILEVLVGRKVFDGRQWRVYDASNVELTAASPGALWRGNVGAILWNAVRGFQDFLIRARRRARR